MQKISESIFLTPVDENEVEAMINHLKEHIPNRIFTGGQFWPSGIVVACVCVCVCVCGNHELVRMITHHPFKLGSPNLGQRCKTTSLRSLLFYGTFDLDLQGQIELKSKFTPFWACPCHNSPPIEVTISKFRTKMHLSTVQIPTNFGLDWNWSSIQFLI